MPTTRSDRKVNKVTTSVVTGSSRKSSNTGNNKKTLAKVKMNSGFKAPPPIFKSPVETRSRRSSMFGISNSKGGIRLNIAITPQEKKFVPATEKALSPPGMVTRTRRSSIYVKGGKLNSLLTDSQKGNDKFAPASDKALSPPGMVTRTRRSSIYIKGGKFTGLLQSGEDLSLVNKVKNSVSPESSVKASHGNQGLADSKDLMAHPANNISPPAASTSMSKSTKTTPAASTSKSKGTTTTPADRTSKSKGTTTTPADRTSKSKGTTTTPADRTSKSKGTTTTPADRTSKSKGTTTTPADRRSKSKGTTTTPAGRTTSKSKGTTTTPTGRTTSKSKDTTTTPADRTSKSEVTRTSTTPLSSTPAITRSSRKRKPSSAGASTDKHVRRTPWSTRASRKRPISETDLNVSLEILAEAEKIPKHNSENVDVFRTPAKSPLKLSQQHSSKENSTKLLKTPFENAIKPNINNHLPGISSNVAAETDTIKEKSNLQQTSVSKLPNDDVLHEDEENIKESMKVHLKKKLKTPKVMIVSPTLVTPVRPPRMKRRRATPGRIEPKERQAEETKLINSSPLDASANSKGKIQEGDSVSIRSDSINDLTVNTTSHSSRAAKCVIL